MSDMTSDVDKELSGNLTSIKPVDAIAQKHAIASSHRRAVWMCKQRISDTTRTQEASVARIEESIRQERDRHIAEMERLSAEIAEIQEFSSKQIKATKSLLASSEAALEALEGL